MSSPNPVSPDNASIDPTCVPGGAGRARRINRLCDEFEDAWRGEHRPAIEAFLAQAAADERDELLRELIGLEIEFRRRAGERPDINDYCRRFSGHTAVVESVNDDTM